MSIQAALGGKKFGLNGYQSHVRDALQIRLATIEILGKDLADTTANLELDKAKEFVILGQSLDVFREVQGGFEDSETVGFVSSVDDVELETSIRDMPSMTVASVLETRIMRQCAKKCTLLCWHTISTEMLTRQTPLFGSVAY